MRLQNLYRRVLDQPIRHSRNATPRAIAIDDNANLDPTAASFPASLLPGSELHKRPRAFLPLLQPARHH